MKKSELREMIREELLNEGVKLNELELKGKKYIKHYLDVYNNPKRYSNVDISKLNDNDPYDLAKKYGILNSKRDKKNGTYKFITKIPSKLQLKENVVESQVRQLARETIRDLMQGKQIKFITPSKDRKETEKVLTKSKLKEIIKEELKQLKESKYPFKDIKVGSKIDYGFNGVLYIVTKLYPGGFLMSMKSKGSNNVGSMFQQKATMEKDNYESQVRTGFIKKVEF